MSDCSRHTKQVGGIADMKLLADGVADLHYEAFAEFLNYLASRLASDAIKDAEACRYKLATELTEASHDLDKVFHHIESAWQLSKPFMYQSPNKQ